MEMNTGKLITVNREKYENLLMLLGRFNAAQGFVNRSVAVSVDDICHILGIDLILYKNRQEDEHKKYMKSLEEGTGYDE